MRRTAAASAFVLCTLLSVFYGSAQTTCDPFGNLRFVCGPIDSEDLITIPDSPWILVSGMQDEGHLYLADTRSTGSFVAYPGNTPSHRHDAETYSKCPGPLPSGFRPHGLNVRPDNSGRHTLYVVRHGGREAVEIFELDTTQEPPSLTWIGCVLPPESVNGNAVVPLPEGGFALTNFLRFGDSNAMANLQSGGPTGEVWEWHHDSDWKIVPDSEISGANGIEISPDGQWFYIGAWGSQSFIRLSRNKLPVTKETVALGFNVDNIHWAPDGSLLAAGQGGGTDTVLACLTQGDCSNMTNDVVKIDPHTLQIQQLIHYPSDAHVISGTAAVQVGSEIWVGSLGGSDRIAIFPLEN